MTQAELIAALPAGRLPAALTQLAPTDLLALFGVGLLLGAAVTVVVSPFLSSRTSRRARIRATRGLPPQERILAVARVLGRLPDPLRGAAYRTDPPPSDPEIERIALAARRRRR